MNGSREYYRYWGKTDKGEGYHPLAYHSLDVAAVGSVFLASHKDMLEEISAMAGFESSDRFQKWFTFFLSLHDLGKFSESFQNLNPDIFFRLQNRKSEMTYGTRHDTLGWILWKNVLKDKLQEYGLLAKGAASSRRVVVQEPVDFFIKAVVGHHGKPPEENKRSIIPKHCFDIELDYKASSLFLRDLIPVLLEDGTLFPDIDLNKVKRASWWLAGLTVFSDWLGSNTDFFPYEKNTSLTLINYWEGSKKKARNALDEVGMLKSSPSSFLGINHLIKIKNDKATEGTPLQKLASGCDLSSPPYLFILEDVTGAGKTEAAVLLAHRLMNEGQGNGLFFALPTMATANAMYSRMGKVYRKMFDDKSDPSIVLSHGARDMSKEFRDSILPRNDGFDTFYGNREMTAGFHCNEWLADNKKKALLADVGVGTIDQALMGILPSRHQSLRLFGLMNKILIVDEVHACDSYMHGLLKGLIHAQAMVGRSVILLSATLPKKQRQELVDAYSEGKGWEKTEITRESYPLMTSCSKNGLSEVGIPTRNSSKREVVVENLSEKEAVYSLLEDTIKNDRCACWIRNTVKDAREAYEEIKHKYPKKVELFHARYAMGDRLDIEERVVKRFGKEGTSEARSGRILIATQVVEQSLDLDFDTLITDLAPIDAIIQRMGRLRRHARDASGNSVQGQDRRGDVRLHLFSPKFIEHPDENWLAHPFEGSRQVYKNSGQLWLTAKVLFERKNILIPEDMRPLIETVYDIEAEIPEGLEKETYQAEGGTRSNASLAEFNKINLGDGYSRQTEDFVWDESNTPTRLGEKTTTLYLAKWEDGKLSPWISRGEKQYLWRLSSVSVHSFYAEKEAHYSEIPQNSIDACKEELPAKGRWGVLLPLVRCGNKWAGKAQGELGIINFSYCQEGGLVDRKDGLDFEM